MDWDFIYSCMYGYKTLVINALPVAFMIGAANLCINILFDAFFHGKLHIGGRDK